MMTSSGIELVVGGARSGKSAYAKSQANVFAASMPGPERGEAAALGRERRPRAVNQDD